MLAWWTYSLYHLIDTFLLQGNYFFSHINDSKFWRLIIKYLNIQLANITDANIRRKMESENQLPLYIKKTILFFLQPFNTFIENMNYYCVTIVVEHHISFFIYENTNIAVISLLIFTIYCSFSLVKIPFYR